MASLGSRISGLILAAGGSSRMGQPKQLLPLDGEPLLRWTVRTALASQLSEVIVVLGHDADSIAVQTADHGQRTIINRHYAAGQSTSLIAGLNALEPAAAGVLVLLGDQPEVRVEVINALIAAYSEGEALIVMPSYNGVTGHPVLFSHSLFPEMRQVTGDLGAKDIIERHHAKLRLVPVAAARPSDVDTPEAYEALLTRWERPPKPLV